MLFGPRMVTYLLRAGPSPPGSRLPILDHSSPHRPSSVRRPSCGPEHPDPGFTSPIDQHNRRPCSLSTSRRNTPCHGFHDSNRYTIRRPVLTTWHGTWIIATQKVLNSIRSSDRFSSPYFSPQRPDSGSSNAAHAFRLQASEAITMYAPLLTRSPTGIASAFTPPFNWAIRFSWSQRSLARSTTSDAEVVRSLVM